MKFERLFSPITIRGMTVKNRIVMPAMHTVYNPDGGANERFNEYFYRRAEGGCGLVITGGASIDEFGGAIGMMDLSDDRVIPGFLKFTEGMHARGAKVGVQLFQAGRYAHPEGNGGRQPIAPSAVYSGYSRATPREMTKDEIRTVIRRGAEAAVRAKKAGFDLVELSGSAGYLVCQFLSPLTNRRSDEYGGSWENRTRFAREYVAAVRAAVGPDYPLAMRIAGHDLVPGSNTNEDAVRFAVEMERAGIDFLNVTGGWHESTVPQITGDLPRGGWSFLVAAVKAAVHIPVAASNRINDPVVAERLLATGVADMVSLGRPLIADPDWCSKAEAGHPELIRRCMACNQGCLARAFFDRPVECLVNGRVGREFQLKDMKPAGDGERKRILVVGGGPAGCEFAIRARELGHEVTLWEREDRLGGQLPMVAAPPHKQEFRSLLSYYKHMLAHRGVQVELGKTADADSVIAGNYDLVLTAMGRGEPKRIPLPLTDGTPVCTAEQVLKAEVMPGKNVLVIGGGSVGLETAEYMAAEASVSPEQLFHMLEHGYETDEQIHGFLHTCYRHITVVDVQKIGLGFDAGTAWPVLKNLDRLGVKRYPFSTVTEIGGGRAVIDVREKTGDPKETVAVPCDTVVLAVGSLPNDGLFRELQARGVNVRNIGDGKRIANILTGVREACELAEELAGIAHPAE